MEKPAYTKLPAKNCPVPDAATDFVRLGLPAISLTTDTSFLTAYANDFDFDGVFARQVQALGKPGDVLLAISTRGKSKNVVRAAQTAREMGMKVIALIRTFGASNDGERRAVRPPVGSAEVEAGRAGSATPPWPPLAKGGKRRKRQDAASTMGRRCRLHPQRQHPICSEAHLAVEHIIRQLVERAIFGGHESGG